MLYVSAASLFAFIKPISNAARLRWLSGHDDLQDSLMK
jgi:hypothetical protein